MKNLKKRKRAGFTLVEMVVVVSILGILAGLGFMKFDQVQMKAKENADKVASTNLVTAASLYINDKPSLQDLEFVDSEKKLKKLEIEKLITSNYITTEPKPQSKEGEFIITISTDTKEVKVDINEKSNTQTDDTKKE